MLSYYSQSCCFRFFISSAVFETTIDYNLTLYITFLTYDIVRTKKNVTLYQNTRLYCVFPAGGFFN